MKEFKHVYSHASFRVKLPDISALNFIGCTKSNTKNNVLKKTD